MSKIAIAISLLKMILECFISIAEDNSKRSHG